MSAGLGAGVRSVYGSDILFTLAASKL